MAGLGMNVVVLQVTLHWFEVAVFSQLLGVCSGFFVNFLAAKFLIFNR